MNTRTEPRPSNQLDIFGGPRLRSTSIQAYRQIRESGALSDQKLAVYRALIDLGSATAGEVAKKLGPSAVRNNVATRISELKACGLVRETDKRPCKISGARAMVFEIIPGALPKKPEPTPRPLRLVDAVRLAEEIGVIARTRGDTELTGKLERLIVMLESVRGR